MFAIMAAGVAAFRQRLRSGDMLYGTCVTSMAPHFPAVVAGAGCDFVFLDTEHVAVDRAALAAACSTYRRAFRGAVRRACGVRA